MKIIAMAATAAMLDALGAHGFARNGIGRVAAGTKLGRQLVSKGYRSRSKYMPHQGAKERERAKRCYMVSAFIGGPERSAPVMMQMSKNNG